MSPFHHVAPRRYERCVPPAGERIQMLCGREEFLYAHGSEDSYANDAILRASPSTFRMHATSWITSPGNVELSPYAQNAGRTRPLRARRMIIWPSMRLLYCEAYSRPSRSVWGNVGKSDRRRRSLQLGHGARG